jgi:hypothetical protein
MFKKTTTSRGFKLHTFQDYYEAPCSIQESSAGSKACIWLGLDSSKDNPEAQRMHLTQDDALGLAELLVYFAKHGDLP